MKESAISMVCLSKSTEEMDWASLLYLENY